MMPQPHHHRAVSAYGQATETVPAARQIVMLYDGMIRRIDEARLACLDGRIEDRWQATQKAARICDALHASLDHDQGGSVAASLAQWYVMIGMKIQQINVSNDPSECSEVIRLMREVRASWEQIITGTPSPPATMPVAGPGLRI
ncbi:flagellar export chaperone FliS [Geminicoccus roseus]|uniref:flagellar export chaperone FliS n=1 Tax=Geminicoccus roseus TaxID=404900 RepID=UPI00042263CC|nr:flagellar export chaperone FliS [Geminicoccus roseus]